MRKCGNCGQPNHNSRTCLKKSQAFTKIKEGLDEALAFAKGDETKAIVHEFSEDDAPPEQNSFNPIVGQWLISKRTNKVAGKIRKITRDSIIYEALIGPLTESKIQDCIDYDYASIDLEPSHLKYLITKEAY